MLLGSQDIKTPGTKEQGGGGEAGATDIDKMRSAAVHHTALSPHGDLELTDLIITC